MWRGAPSWTALAVTATGAAYVQSRYGAAYFAPRSFGTYALVNWTMLVALRLFWTIYVWPRYCSALRYLPQPAENRSFWSSVKLIADEEDGLVHRAWINTVPNDGLLRYIVMGGGERIFLTDPKAVAEVIVARSYDYHRPPVFAEVLGRILGGTGLLLAEGNAHRHQRKNLTPAFSVPHVKDLVPTFYALSARMVQLVTADVRQQQRQRQQAAAAAAAHHSGTVVEEVGVVQFDNWISRATLDIIGAAGMGVDFGALDDPTNELSEAYRQAATVSLQERLLQVASLFISYRWLWYLPIHRNRELQEGMSKIRATSHALIAKKQQEILEKGSSEHKDILSIALGSGQFTVENLVDQVMTFLAAGHETTATATQWAMVALAQNPHVQERLRSEIRENLPSIEGNSFITSDDIDKLPYLKACCNEILRFYPPAPFTQRVAIVDTQIMGHRIPKGTDVVIPPAALNASKEVWGEDAETFNPERWLQPGCAISGGAESPYANMTFTSGPRGCIGVAFAKYEFLCIVAAIIGRFEVELDPPDRKIECETSVVSRPKGGLPLRMKVIGGW